MNPTISDFATYLTLAYHEARNVRHLARAGLVKKETYQSLIDGLPSNRDEAWKALQELRCEASHARSAKAAEAVFKGRFGLSLEDLALLSRDEHWKGSNRGGNRWAEIDQMIIELRDSIDADNRGRIDRCLERLNAMRHNTGTVAEKLNLLETPKAATQRKEDRLGTSER